jgi:phospholipase C
MPSAHQDRFDHLVVLMLENRSFDNLFGYLYERPAGLDKS